MAEHLERMLQFMRNGSHEIAIHFPRVDEDPRAWTSARVVSSSFGSSEA
jgi:hypothetical protein